MQARAGVAAVGDPHRDRLASPQCEHSLALTLGVSQ